MALCLGVVIALAFTGWDCQAFYLTASYLFKLRLPAFTRLGDEKQDQTVPSFAEFVVARILHIEEDAI